MSVEKSSNIKS